MSNTESSVHSSGEGPQCVTFYVAGQLMGVDIQEVQEINRHRGATSIPHSSRLVRGVINLRGDVVTVVDLRSVLGLKPAEMTPASRNVIVSTSGEKVGLLVDRVADVVACKTAEIESPPANVKGVDGRFFKGVCKLDSELLVILDIDEVFAGERVSATT